MNPFTINLRDGAWYVNTLLPNGERFRKALGIREGEMDEAQVRKVAESLILRYLNYKPAKALPQATQDYDEELAAAMNITIKEAYTFCMRMYEGWRESKSKRSIEENYRKVASYWGEDRKLSSIKRKDVLEWIATMKEQPIKAREGVVGLSGSTINQRLSLLSILFKQAAPELTAPKFPRQKTSEGRKRRISPEEEAELLRWFAKGIHPAHADMYDIVVCLVELGCRPSELFRLTDKDCDLPGRKLEIWENKASFPTPKPIMERTAAILERRFSGHKVQAFPGWTVDKLDHHWQWVRSKMNLEHDKEFIPYALRHTAASRVAKVARNSFAVQRFMGHKLLSTAEKYVHMEIGDMTELIDEMNKSAVPLCQENHQGDIS